MLRDKQIALLAQLDQFMLVVEGIMSRAKVREDRIAIAVRLARLEQTITAIREKWNIPSTVVV